MARIEVEDALLMADLALGILSTLSKYDPELTPENIAKRVEDKKAGVDKLFDEVLGDPT